MPYHVKTIENIGQISSCEIFRIDNYQWTGSYRPKAFGSMGIIDKQGIIISMTAMERDPLRRYTCNDDPVYEDSGLEAFFNFSPKRETNQYVNFEMNANGAMISTFGDKYNRTSLKQLSKYTASCKASIEKESWNILIQIPMELICDLFQIEPLKKGDRFSCNFYKISETSAIEHYASYAPINSPEPNFHLPEFFGDAIID